MKLLLRAQLARPRSPNSKVSSRAQRLKLLLRARLARPRSPNSKVCHPERSEGSAFYVEGSSSIAKKFITSETPSSTIAPAHEEPPALAFRPASCSQPAARCRVPQSSRNLKTLSSRSAARDLLFTSRAAARSRRKFTTSETPSSTIAPAHEEPAALASGRHRVLNQPPVAVYRNPPET